jgi:hypothetical protein
LQIRVEHGKISRITNFQAEKRLKKIHKKYIFLNSKSDLWPKADTTFPILPFGRRFFA